VEPEKLGATLYEIQPGQRTFPYHWHNALEEMGIVLHARRRCATYRASGGSRRAMSCSSGAARTARTSSETTPTSPCGS
jgi:hypothetical protein